jgi:hypothetical protein
MVEAVKRVRGMRLVGLARRARAGQRAAAPAVVANRTTLAVHPAAQATEQTQEQD